MSLNIGRIKKSICYRFKKILYRLGRFNLPYIAEVQRGVSRAFHLLGGSRKLFGDEAADRLEATRRGKLEEISNSAGRSYLLSFPRSGNHWVRFILEFFSGVPTQGTEVNPRDIPIHRNLFRSLVNPLGHVQGSGEFLFYKSHCFYPAYGGREDPAKVLKSHFVILLIRDYHECIQVDFDRDIPGKVQWYLEVFNVYERIKARKMHVYYEDLILSPEKTIASILAACGIDNPPLLEYFMRHYPRMQFLSRTAKNRDWRSAESKSGDDIYYQRRRVDDWDKFDETFQQIYSESRYDKIRHLIDRYRAPSAT